MAQGYVGRSGYRPDIDGLRGIAVLLVLLNHAEIPPFRGGFLGVDVFFVISGYLITSIVIRELQAGNFRYVSFVERRARRILPALFAMLLPVTIAASIILVGPDREDFFQSLVSVASFWSNIRFYLDIGYFDTAAAFKPLLHTWSLGVEEQFYLLYPIFLISLSVLSLSRRVAVIFFVTLASFIGMLLVSNGAAFYLLPFRGWELLVGALIALIRETDWFGAFAADRGKRPISGLATVGLVAILAAASLISKDTVWPSGMTVVPVVGTALILMGATPDSKAAKLLSTRPLILLGLCSYSVYLWHYPLFALVRYRTGGLGNDSKVFLVALSIFVGWCSWRLIETPFRDGARIGRRLVLIGSLVGSFAFSAAGLLPLVLSERSGEVASPQLPTLGRSILLIGDSHAAHLVPGLLPHLGESLAVSQSAGCVPFWGVDRFDSRFQPGACASFATDALRTAVESEEVKLVVLASMGPVYITGETFRGYDPARVTGDGLLLVDRPDVTDRWQVFETGLRETLKRLQEGGKKVVVIIDVPELGIPAQNCNPSEPESCENLRSDVDKRNNRYRELVKRVSSEFPNASVFDPTYLFCDQSRCFGLKDGRQLYSDGDHLSEFGSKYVGDTLGNFLIAELGES